MNYTRLSIHRHDIPPNPVHGIKPHPLNQAPSHCTEYTHTVDMASKMQPSSVHSDASLHSDGQNSISNTPTTPTTQLTTSPLGLTPTAEDPPLTRSTQVVILSDMHPCHRTWNKYSPMSAVEFCASIPTSEHPAKSVLIVEEINEEWTALLSPLLPSTDPDFIKQHFNRLDDSGVGSRGARASESVAITDISQHHAPAAKVAGFHLDGIRTVQSLRCQVNRPIKPWSAAETGMCFLQSATVKPLPEHIHRPQAHCRREVFIRSSEKKWEKATSRISGCELHDGLCKSPPLPFPPSRSSSSSSDLRTTPDLFLVDAPLPIKPNAHQPYHEILQRRTGDGLTLPMNNEDWPNGKIFRPLDLLQLMCRTFTLSAVLESLSIASRGLVTRRPDFVLHWMLAVAAWEAVVCHIESDMRRQQHQAATDVDMTTFTALSNFRRQLADAREGIGNTRAAILYELEDAESQVCYLLALSCFILTITETSRSHILLQSLF